MTKAVGTAGGTATGYVFFAARRTALATLLFMCVVTVIWSYFMNTLKKSGGFLKARVKGRLQ